MIELIKKEILQNPIYVDSRKFEPHITVYKARKRVKKGIDNSIYSSVTEEEFGIQILKGIDLLSMQGEGTNGYYKSFASFSFETNKFQIECPLLPDFLIPKEKYIQQKQILEKEETIDKPVVLSIIEK